jgi:hypothetical protein
MADTPTALTCKAFRLPKAGNTMNECEDACAGDADGRRFAVADGASESGFAAAWARLLVEGYVKNPGAWSAWLPEARRMWQANAEEDDLPWYAEAKLQEGAFATLLGLAFDEDLGAWQAEAVGDTCLFQVRGDRLRRTFPVRHSADFSNRPVLLGSRRLDGQQGRTNRGRCRGDWRPGDFLLLMTDALAQWFLQETEGGRSAWRELLALKSQEHFADWIDRRRQTRELRNDDVTLLCIRFAARKEA